VVDVVVGAVEDGAGSGLAAAVVGLAASVDGLVGWGRGNWVVVE